MLKKFGKTIKKCTLGLLMLATALASAALVPVKPATGQLLNPGRPAQGFVVSDVEFPTSQKASNHRPDLFQSSIYRGIYGKYRNKS